MTSTTNVAIVTGAAQGIGAAISIRLAKDGFNVAVNDLASKQDSIDSIVREIKALGRDAIAIPGDVSLEEDVKSMIASTVECLGGLDVMVANAGIFIPQGFCHLIDNALTMETWDNIMKVNALGAFLCYKHAAIQMIAQGRGGSIIGTCSLAGKQGMVGTSVYGMSKFAIRGLTQTAALELRSHNIRVNGIAPGIVETELVKSIKLPEGVTDRMSFIKGFTGFSADTPHCDTDPMASMVSYLASPESHFITGQTISVDGGIYFD